MRSISARIVPILSLLTAIAGCGGDSGPTPVTPTKVVFRAQPSTVFAGAAIAPAVQVTLEDANGMVATGSSGPVTIAIDHNPAAGTLSGTLTVAAVAGVATFADLGIDKAGTGYTLSASSGGLTGATSSGFTVATPPVAIRLAFIGQPSNVVGGVAIAPAVKVAVQDQNGITVTTSTAEVSILMGINPGGLAMLSGTATVNAVAGVATFSNLRVDRPATGYTLAALAVGLTGAESGTFDVVAPPPVSGSAPPSR